MSGIIFPDDAPPSREFNDGINAGYWLDPEGVAISISDIDIHPIHSTPNMLKPSY